MKSIYVVVGVPGSGKTWLCNQLKEKFEYVAHDEYLYAKNPTAYRTAIVYARANSTKEHLLIEAPFSMKIIDELEGMGYQITPIFLEEKPEILLKRYEARMQKKHSAISGHLTRQETFKTRAHARKAFIGTSSEALQHLKGLKPV